MARDGIMALEQALVILFTSYSAGNCGDVFMIDSVISMANLWRRLHLVFSIPSSKLEKLLAQEV